MIESENKTAQNKKIILIIICILLICLSEYFAYNKFIKENNQPIDNSNNEGFTEGFSVYLTDYDTYYVFLNSNLPSETNEEYKLVKTISFQNKNAELLSKFYLENQGYIVYYDDDIIVYDVKNDKKINLNIKPEEIRENLNIELNNITASVNIDEQKNIIGVIFENLYNSAFYYDVSKDKIILDDYLSIRTTDNPNYLLLAIDYGQDILYTKIYDLENEKIIVDTSICDDLISILEIKILNVNNKRFIITDSWRLETFMPTNFYIFDEKGENINTIKNAYEYLFAANNDGYYFIEEDKKIVKYTLSGMKVSSSKEYEMILGISSIYSIVVEEGDIFLIKNDESYRKKIFKVDELNLENSDILPYTIPYATFDEEKNIISIYDADTTYKYTLNLKTDELTKIED